LKLTKASQKPRRQKLQLLQLPGARATPPASSACPRKRIQTIRKDFPVGRNEIQIPRKVTQTLFLCELAKSFRGLAPNQGEIAKIAVLGPRSTAVRRGRPPGQGSRRWATAPSRRSPCRWRPAPAASWERCSCSVPCLAVHARGVAGEEENIKRDGRHHELCGERRHDGVVRDSTHWVMGERQAETTAMSSRSLTRRKGVSMAGSEPLSHGYCAGTPSFTKR
jgi:hypothetical protein